MAEQPMEAPAPKAAPQPEPEPARSSGLSPVELESGRVPFQRTDLTWGSICSSISNMWGSDLNARETMLNWLVVAILVATSVLKCWSLATEVCENTFQDVVDIISIATTILWGIWLIGYVKRAHPEQVRPAFGTASLSYHMLVGNTSSLTWDVITKCVIGLFFKIQANTYYNSCDAGGGGMAATTIIMLALQAVSYVMLWLIIVAIENSYSRIKFLALMATLHQVIHLVVNIINHVILVMNEEDAHSVANATAAGDTVAPQSAAFISSRVLSLGVFVALRLTCFQFFGFKRKYPHMAYCKDSKEPVDALEFASEDDLKRLDSDGAAGGEVGFGGVKVRSPGEPPRTIDSLRRRP